MGCAKIRAATSSGPPAGKGTTMVMVRAGQSWAWIGSFGASTTTASVAAMSLSSIASLPRVRTTTERMLSVCACSACLERACPSLDLAWNELGQICRGSALCGRNGHADAFEALADSRRLHCFVRSLGEAPHDVSRRTFRKRQRAPAAAVETGKAHLLRGRQIFDAGRPLEPERGDRLHRVALDLRKRRRDLFGNEVDAAADQILHRRAGTAIGHMSD